MTKPKNNLDIHQKFAEFERQNPKVAEAMRLLGVSVEKYQGVLHAMSAPRIYVSNSTTSKEQQQNG